MSSNFINKRFGKYLLLDHLIDGGMAKICRARFLNDEIARIVAIKMVHPKHSKEKSFKTMFMDEIKVSFGLLHPNIVQIYDYGICQEQLYVALEYSHGKNLKEYLDKLKQRKYVFPVEISVHIITSVCQGLYYAHTYVDKLTGKKANIVHRDISPHNIMLAYDGSIKIIDFGIAKASTNSEETQAGTIKGKLSYMAPEYLEGETLDHRYDQFATAITLWEMLCNRKLFTAKNDLAILKKIQECNVPAPSSINPNVPRELDQIILKALSKDRNNRYTSMDAFNRVLMKFLYANYPDFNPSDLSFFANDLFKEEIKVDRAKLVAFGKIDIKQYLHEVKEEELKGVNYNSDANKTKSNSTLTTSETSHKRKEMEFVLEDDITNDETTEVTTTKSLKIKIDDTNKINKKNNKPKTVSKNHTTNISAQNNIKSNNSTNKASTTDLHRNINKDKIGKIKKKSSSPLFKVAIVSGLLFGAYTQKNLILKTLTSNTKVQKVIMAYDKFHKSSGTSKNIQNLDGKQLENSTKSLKEVYSIQLNNFDAFVYTAFINNKKVSPDIFNKIKVKSSSDYTLRIEKKGYLPQVFFIKNITSNLTYNIEKFKTASFAQIFMSNKCSSGELSYKLYGENIKIKVPFERKNILKFPMGNTRGIASDQKIKYILYYKEDGSAFQKKIIFNIEEGKSNYDFCHLLSTI